MLSKLSNVVTVFKVSYHNKNIVLYDLYNIKIAQGNPADRRKVQVKLLKS